MLLIRRSVVFTAGLACMLAVCFCAPARADVGIVLNESLDTSVARITGSGHSAVYLSRVCPETPVKLRLCRPGEQGSVVSNYTSLGEDEPFEWNAVPLDVYLYGVMNAQFRPVVGTPEIKHVLEERYRDEFLAAYCDTESCRTNKDAEWRDTVGATLSRSIYIFVVQTTVEQDRALIAELNALPNRNHFNPITRNCANFTKHIVNFYFPHAVSRNWINDFGMASPKGISRSFTHYADKHPEMGLRVMHFAQLPGTIKRSSQTREGTEQLFHSKKLLLPMALFATHELPAFAFSYALTGRFNPERELEKHPDQQASDIALQFGLPETRADARFKQPGERGAQYLVVGSASAWKEYRAEYASIEEDASRDGILPLHYDRERLFKKLDEGVPAVDPDGTLWLEFVNQNGAFRLAVSANRLFDAGADPRQLFVLLLARVGSVLTSPKHSRETMVEFQNDWAALLQAQARLDTRSPRNTMTASVAESGEGLRSAGNN